MPHSKHLFKSNKLNEFINAYTKATNQKEKDFLWDGITTPFIEKIAEDKNNSLVTPV